MKDKSVLTMNIMQLSKRVFASIELNDSLHTELETN